MAEFHLKQICALPTYIEELLDTIRKQEIRMRGLLSVDIIEEMLLERVNTNNELMSAQAEGQKDTENINQAETRPEEKGTDSGEVF